MNGLHKHNPPPRARARRLPLACPHNPIQPTNHQPLTGHQGAHRNFQRSTSFSSFPPLPAALLHPANESQWRVPPSATSRIDAEAQTRPAAGWHLSSLPPPEKVQRVDAVGTTGGGRGGGGGGRAAWLESCVADCELCSSSDLAGRAVGAAFVAEEVGEGFVEGCFNGVPAVRHLRFVCC